MPSGPRCRRDVNGVGGPLAIPPARGSGSDVGMTTQVAATMIEMGSAGPTSAVHGEAIPRLAPQPVGVAPRTRAGTGGHRPVAHARVFVTAAPGLCGARIAVAMNAILDAAVGAGRAVMVPLRGGGGGWAQVRRSLPHARCLTTTDGCERLHAALAPEAESDAVQVGHVEAAVAHPFDDSEAAEVVEDAPPAHLRMFGRKPVRGR